VKQGKLPVGKPLTLTLELPMVHGCVCQGFAHGDGPHDLQIIDASHPSFIQDSKMLIFFSTNPPSALCHW
jgi:hypothetical protein